jgi:alpha-ketoglutaric semialdehyde dehydrogenase
MSVSEASTSCVITSVSPQDPDDLVAEVEATRPATVAVLAARSAAAVRQWQSATAAERAGALGRAADALHRAAAPLTDLIVREVGKPRREASAEVARGVGILRYYAQRSLDPVGETLPGPTESAQIFTRRRARGVAGLITPWNFPVAIPLWKAAPALAYGNGVLWKPSSKAVGIAERLARLIGSVLPEDLVALVPGEAATATAVIENADVVSFTGSTAVGRSVVTRCGERGIPCQAEMGGSNYAVITPSADLQRASSQIAAAAFAYAGQKCTATSHVLVIGDGRQAEQALAVATESLTVDDPDSAASDCGPLIDQSAAQRCERAWVQARDGGARLICEAGRRAGVAWQPLRLVADVPAASALGCEEVFGPIATVAVIQELDDAIEVVNSGRYGLVSSVHTADLKDAIRFSAQVRTGMVKVNAPTTGVDYWAPFGGDRDSSFGPREQGLAAAQLYSTTQTTTLEWPL